MFHSSLLSHAKAETATSILIFGDSIVAGYGLKAPQSLPVQLEQLLQNSGYNVKVINGGVSGDTTGAGRNRLEWTLKKHKPQVVVLALGGNDVLRGVQPRESYENLDAMLEILSKYQNITVLSEVTAPANLGVQYQRDFNKIYPYLSQKYQVPLYPFLLQSTFGNNELMMKDQVHPNAKGIKVIARELAIYLGQYILPSVDYYLQQ